MRWATFRHGTANADRVGLVVGEQIYALERGIALLDLLGDDGERLARAGERALRAPADVIALESARLRPPIPRPPSFRDFYAFEQHVRTARRRRGLDMEPDWYQLPVFYFSNPHTLIGSGDEVVAPSGCQELDFELEVAAVVGRGGADLDPSEAAQRIAGFTILNDWSARDVQRREMRLSLGPAKGKDFASSFGPLLVTTDEIEPFCQGKAYDLSMTAKVNDKEYSRASLAEIYWSFGEMLAYASRGSRIATGDIIGSGTCGTGCILELSLVHGQEKYPWLKPGDEVELSVARLGTLRNRIVSGPATGVTVVC